MPATLPALHDLEIVTKLDQLYVQARTRRRRYSEEWRRNYMLTNNKMYSDLRTSNWMPSPTSSEIYPIVSALIAWMTDQQVTFSCSAASDPHTLYAQWLGTLANDLEVVLQQNWINHHMDDEEYLMLWDAALYGTGILKSIWDAGAVDGLGDAMIHRIDPWSFYPDPNATSLKDAQYFVEVQRLSFDEVQRRYPLAYDKLIAEEAFYTQQTSTDYDSKPNYLDDSTFPKTNPGNMPQSNSTSYGLPGQGKVRAIQSPGCIIQEFWLRENVAEDIKDSPQKEKPNPTMEYPDTIVHDEWRVIVMSSGVVLMDEYASDLWGSGRHPYSRFCFDDIGEFWGISLVSHLAPAQIAINRLLTTLQHNAELIGNPVFLESDDSGISRTTIVNRPGQRLRTKGGPNANPNNKPGWMPPPQMPSFINDLIQFWINRMENISGLGQVSKGSLPPARTPASSVANSQESGFVRVRQAMRNLESTVRDAGDMLVELITENYTTPRTVAIVGSDGEQSSLQLASRHFIDPTSEGATPWKFSLLIDAGADNPTSRQSRIAEADTLAAMNMLDREAVLQAHNYPHWQEINSRMEAKEQQQAQLAAQQKSKVKGGK